MFQFILASEFSIIIIIIIIIIIVVVVVIVIIIIIIFFFVWGVGFRIFLPILSLSLWLLEERQYPFFPTRHGDMKWDTL